MEEIGNGINTENFLPNIFVTVCVYISVFAHQNLGESRFSRFSWWLWTLAMKAVVWLFSQRPIQIIFVFCLCMRFVFYLIQLATEHMTMFNDNKYKKVLCALVNCLLQLVSTAITVIAMKKALAMF